MKLAVRAIAAITVGVVLFGARIPVDLLSATVVFLVGAGAFLALGLLLATFIKTVSAAASAAQLVLFPMLFLGQVFGPLDNAPRWLQAISTMVPLTPLAHGLREAFAGTVDRVVVGADIGVLGAWLISTSVVAVYRIWTRAPIREP